MAKITFNWYVYDSTDENDWLKSLLTGMYMFYRLIQLAKTTFNWYVYDSTDEQEWLMSLLTGMYMILQMKTIG